MTLWLDLTVGDLVVGVATFSLAVGTFILALMAKKQADASVQMAETMLCPVLEQWVPETTLSVQNSKVKITVNYRNVGDGPASNIQWFLYKDNRVICTHRRVGMGSREKEAPVDFLIDVSIAKDGLKVTAEYESVLGTTWRSTLPFQAKTAEGESYYLKNGEPKFERIRTRTKLEEEVPHHDT